MASVSLQIETQKRDVGFQRAAKERMAFILRFRRQVQLPSFFTASTA